MNRIPLYFAIICWGCALTFAAMPVCSCWAGEAGKPIEASKLELVRRELESYLSQIQTLHVAYDSLIYQSNGGDPLSPIGRSTSDVLCRLDDGSFRELRTSPIHVDGSDIGMREEETYIRAGQRLTLNRTTSEAAIDNVDDQRKAISRLFLLQAIGLPLHTTHQTRLSELLRFPEVTRDLGTTMLRETDVLVLQIGPGLPASAIEGHTLWSDGWMRLSLAVKEHFLPLRTEIYMKVPADRPGDWYRKKGIEVVDAPDAAGRTCEYYRMLADVLEVRDVPDVARNRSIPFPWRVNTVSALTISIVCKDVVVNPPAHASAFTTSVPPDFSLLVDQKVTRVRLVDVGADSNVEVVNVQAFGAKAREILDRPITAVGSQPAKWGGVAWWSVGGVSLMVLIVASLKRRWSHD